VNPARSSSGGAAGVILRGRFGMEVANLHMNRPVGPPMVLTRGEEGHIFDLDHQPAGQGPWGGGVLLSTQTLVSCTRNILDLNRYLNP
jgi:hypothetical protein